MYPSALLARADRVLRPVVVRLPAGLAVRLYSAGRDHFLKRLAAEGEALDPITPPPELARTLWGIRFRTPLGNAAGMFKNGQAYVLCANQGAGYYLAGTTTATPRLGNRRDGVTRPFAPYPRSGAASNWLGLPNDGHAAVAARLARVVRDQRVDGCPVGASLAASPGEDEARQIAGLLDGLRRYADAGVDFLEINESCPNTEDAGRSGRAGQDPLAALRGRLEQIAEGFLARSGPTRTGSAGGRPPVLVKLSVDTDRGQVPALVALLRELGFAGIDLGNTSTAYAARRAAIAPAERRLYDRFVLRFGGGVSGRPLKEISLELAQSAARAVDEAARGTTAEARPGAASEAADGHAESAGQRPWSWQTREFHVLRTGGIETGADLAASERAGIALDGWFTGYFEAFAEHGHGVYRVMYEETVAELG